MVYAALMVLGDGVRDDATGGPRAVVPLMVLGDGVHTGINT